MALLALRTVSASDLGWTRDPETPAARIVCTERRLAVVAMRVTLSGIVDYLKAE